MHYEFVLILRLSIAVVAVMKLCPNEYEIWVIYFVTSSSDLLLRYIYFCILLCFLCL